MDVVISFARWHDASYPFKAIGAADGRVITGERGAGYYPSPVDNGGEPPGPGGSGWSGRTAREQGLGDRRVSGQDDRLVRLPPITEHARTRRAAREGPWHRPDRRALANMCQFANARTPAPTSSAR